MPEAKHSYRIVPLIAAILLHTSIAFGQISLKAKIDSGIIDVGDVVTLSIEIRHHEDIILKGSQFVDSLKQFELLYLSDVDSSYDQSFVTIKKDFGFQCFESGEQILPSFRLFYTQKKDTSLKWINSDTFHIQVNLLDVDTSKAIKPIQAPLRVPLSWKDLRFFVIVYPALLLISLLILYFERKKKNQGLFTKTEKPQMPAHLIALAELRKLEEAKLWQKGDIKDYHIQITDIIRSYIENRYQIPAIESTTNEIEQDMASVKLPQNLRAALFDFLHLSDLVKFAKLTPLPDENEKCMQTAYLFVNTTKESIHTEKNEEDNAG
jgi:hypothetical protein